MIYIYFNPNYPNGYYITNKNQKIRTYKVSSNVKFYIYYPYVPTNGVALELKCVGYSEFKQYIKDGTVDVMFEGDEIIQVKQVSLP